MPLHGSRGTRRRRLARALLVAVAVAVATLVLGAAVPQDRDEAGPLRSLPAHLVVTLVLAAAPISELRGAIPYALFSGGFPWTLAYLVAVVGNFLPVLPILFLLGPVEKALRRYRFFDTFFSWLFKRTRRKGRVIEKYEALGLIAFVAIPAPVTGAYTGAVAAYVFGLSRRLAAPAILCGILIAGVIVTLACTGVISLWNIGKH